MRRELLGRLVCPRCPDARALVLGAASTRGGEIVSGQLVCAACRTSYPIDKGIPRFAGIALATTALDRRLASLRTLQIDRLSGHALTRDRLLAITGWDPGWIKDKLVLDIEGSAGRFADALASLGARVVAIGRGPSIEACRDNCAPHGERVACIEASVGALPFPPACFDAVLCGDASAPAHGLARYLKPDGLIAWHASRTGATEATSALHRIAAGVPPRGLWRLTCALVALCFPLAYTFRRMPGLGGLARRLPIVAAPRRPLTLRQQYAWTLLDTFDRYRALRLVPESALGRQDPHLVL